MRILYLDLDTLRPDHLGCYGYHRNTSPNIDRIAEEGVRFDNYYCSDAPCLPSRAALMTGRFGIRSGVVGHGGTAADLRLQGADRGFQNFLNTESLPFVFRRAGMRTVCISPFAERHSSYWFYAGFNEMHNPGKCGGESAEEVTPTVLDWIERNASEDDWYLHVNYWDAHTPYRAPDDFGNPFADDPLPAWITDDVLDLQQNMVGAHKPREIATGFDSRSPWKENYWRYPGEIRDREGLRRMIDGYDCGIRYMDGHIGQLFAALEEAGVMDDLAIVISADHGENQGELGIYGEHGTSDYITHRIPMIVRWPDGRQGAVDDELHYNLDLAPTCAELLGVDGCESWDGGSFAPEIYGESGSGHEYLVLSQMAHVCQRSVRFGPWHYIRTYHDGFHLFPKEMLFNVDTDPHEQHNLARRQREVCWQANWYLDEWHDAMMKKMSPDCTVDPMWTVIAEGGPLHAQATKVLPTYVEYLRRTDRAWAIPELKRRHPEAFPHDDD